MKTFFYWWFVFQLVLLGMADVSIENEVINNTYNCKLKEVPLWVGALFPLALFIPNTDVVAYCEGKR